MMNILKQKIFNLLDWKTLSVVIIDFLVILLCLYLSIILRLGGIWENRLNPYLVYFFLIPVVSLPIFLNLGLYKAVIRYLDSRVVRVVAIGTIFSMIVLISLVLFLHIHAFPRTSVLIYGLLLMLFLGGSRFLLRDLFYQAQYLNNASNVAIYGAGDAGIQLLESLKYNKQYSAVAFFDDDPTKQSKIIRGLMVYPRNEIKQVLISLDIKTVLLAIPSANMLKQKELVNFFEGLDVFVQIMPGLNDLVQGTASINQLSNYSIEDLLGRDTVSIADGVIDNISAKAILVTGAGGSIGSELCRQIIENKPKLLVLYELSEFALYSIHQELSLKYPQLELYPILANTLDYNKLDSVVKKYKIDTVYHASAYKHVPLVESNICIGVYNNVFSTLNLAKVCLSNNVSTMVLISTDKAVRPTNVMGASKRLAELVMQAYAAISTSTVFTMVRFGNVLGSSGSVVPLFKKQIAQGGPITVTHPDITRYFMTIPEATKLVIQASNLAGGGEVFVLDMGQPVKIVDLAKKMIYLSGHKLRTEKNTDGIEIIYSGLRPGEKLYEELLIGNQPLATKHPQIFKAQESMLEFEYLMQQLDILSDYIVQNDWLNTVIILKLLVSEFETKLIEEVI